MHILSSETSEAIDNFKKSEFQGLDDISNLQQKNLGGYGRKNLSENFQLSTAYLRYQACKTSKTNGLLKPGKTSNAAKSYRPAFYFAPAIKKLENTLQS